jgi:hypothetical protein
MRRGVVRDCRAAKIIRELYGGVGAGPPRLGIDVALEWRSIIRRALCFSQVGKERGDGRESTHLVVPHDD